LSGAHVLGLAFGSALASLSGTHVLGLALVISGTILVALRASGHARCASRHLSKPEDEPEGALNIESLEKQCFVAFCEPGDEKAQRQHIVSRLTSATPGTLIEQLALQRQFEKDSFLAADDDDTAVAGAALRRDAAGAAVEAAVASVEDSVRTGLSLNAARKKEDEISVAPGLVAPEAAAKRAAADRPRISRGGDSFDHCFSAAQPDEKAQRQHMVSRLTSGTPGTFIEELSLQRQFSKSFLACDVDVTAVAGAFTSKTSLQDSMGGSACSRSCEPGEEEEGEPTLTPEERERYEQEFEQHVQKALKDGAVQVFCESCQTRFVSRSGTSKKCPNCR